MTTIQIIGILVGAITGYLIGKFFSKNTMAVCPILCNPKISTIYFALLGYLLTSNKNL
ncbi:MAG: hypothetical protein N3F03_00150 [Ignavibacteria bacterium]|nr:hypothetical protein [Ignavibacteria bacterium]